MELRKLFGRRVAAFRKARGMTQYELAEASGLSEDMVTKIEIGATGARFPSIEKLADALGVVPAELFTTHTLSKANDRPALSQIVAKLAVLSDRELAWVEPILDAALKSRR